MLSPAKVAGVDEIIMVTPPGQDGKVNPNTLVAAKEAGLVRSEGKEYVMKDGDIVLFRFNV